MGDRSTGKRVRFEILKRDGFRCRYCGVTATATLLHVDHVVPVAEGGTDDPSNLVTACPDCNLGKSSVSLDESLLPNQTPTEDMIEHAEQLRAYLAAARERDAAIAEMAAYVTETWKAHVSSYMQRGLEVQLPGLIRDRGLDDVLDAIYAVGRSTANSADHRTRYFFGVLRNKRASRGGV